MRSSNPAQDRRDLLRDAGRARDPGRRRGRGAPALGRDPAGARRGRSVRVRARADRHLRRPPGTAPGRAERVPLRRAHRSSSAVSSSGRACTSRSSARSRSRSTRFCARPASTSFCAIIPRVFEIGNSLREARTRRQIDLTRPSRRRRSESATCGRSRTSASSSSRPRPTSRASCGPTPTTSASTASSTSTSSTPGSRPATTTTRAAALLRAAGAPHTPARDQHRPDRGRPRRDRDARRHERLADLRLRVEGAEGRAPRHRRTRRPRVPRPHAFLEISAVSGPSYVTVHRGGPTGRLLFQGTISKGSTEPFTGKHFWVSASSPRTSASWSPGSESRSAATSRSRSP